MRIASADIHHTAALLLPATPAGATAATAGTTAPVVRIRQVDTTFEPHAASKPSKPWKGKPATGKRRRKPAPRPNH